MPALSEKKTELAAKYEEELQRTGKLHFTNDEDFAAYFDAQARKLVGMSGRQALKRMLSHRCLESTKRFPQLPQRRRRLSPTNLTRYTFGRGPTFLLVKPWKWLRKRAIID